MRALGVVSKNTNGLETRFTVAGWILRDQQAAIVYLLEENRVLKAPLREKQIRFTVANVRPVRVFGHDGFPTGVGLHGLTSASTRGLGRSPNFRW